MDKLFRNISELLNNDELQSINVNYERQGDVENINIEINKRENLIVNIDSLNVDKSWVDKGINQAIKEVSEELKNKVLNNFNKSSYR